MKKTTNTLTEILKKTHPEKIGEYFDRNAEDLLTQENPFAAYIRERVRAHGMKLQDVFLHADISEGYGYKLISGEKHTRRRDVVLKLCLGAAFSLEETQRALKIYGMSPLYARFPRDAVFISAISAGKNDLAQINRLLLQSGQPKLWGSEEL